MARPPTYQSAEEKPVTVSARVPVELYAQAKAYAGQRRMSLTDVLLDGLRLRLETPAGPRDIIVAQDNTVIQEETVQVSDVGDTACQTAVPPFDTSKRYLGPLCPQGHDWAGTGQSLRNKKSHNCLACNRTYRREAATGGNKGMAVSV